jgi:NAD(P)-dependent dehydrogenase (short-subunit alcohol dehydrogenase family)
MGQVVVVTGASAGVGRAIVRRFAEEGADLGLIARGRERLDQTVRDVERRGRRALAAPADVADAEAVEQAAGRVEAELGPIDVWVNDAMATVFAPVLDTTPEEFRRATEVTYLGSVWGTMAALRRMVPRDRGVIVQVGSALAFRGIPLQAPYCGAKHALQGFLDSVRAELLHRGSAVRVTSVHVPALNTPQFSWGRTKLPRHPQPVPPIYQPEVGAEAVVWAARHTRREVWVGGSTVATIVGNRVAPGLIDRYLGRRGVQDQQSEEPVEEGRPDNLFEPAPGDWAARGVFADRAHTRSLQFWATRNRGALALGTAAALALALARRED